MKKIAIVFAALSALALSACGPDNVAACKAYVEHFNGLECLADGTDLDEATTCPESLNSGANCTEYYNCLTEAAQCDADGNFTNDISGCTGCS